MSFLPGKSRNIFEYENRSMKQLLQNGIAWIVKMWPFILILAGGFGWYGKDQVAKQAVNDSISLVLKESRETRSAIKDYYDFKEKSNSRMNIIEGSYRALDNSYVRTLVNQIKDKDEKAKYQEEKIQMLEQALKKNSMPEIQ